MQRPWGRKEVGAYEDQKEGRCGCTTGRKESLTRDEDGEIDVIQKMLCLISKEFDFILRTVRTTEKFGAGTKRI